MIDKSVIQLSLIIIGIYEGVLNKTVVTRIKAKD